jgi:hypothetical protein
MAARVYSIARTAWVCIKNICSTDNGGGGGGSYCCWGSSSCWHVATAEHACLLGACCQTSIEGIHTSSLILQSFNIR